MTRIKARLRVNESKVDKWARTGLVSGLRLLWLRSALRNEALTRNRVPINLKGTRFVYPCEKCSKHLTSKQVEIDHIDGCGSMLSLSDLPSFVSRLFCASDRLQRLCKSCHYVKTYNVSDDL